VKHFTPSQDPAEGLGVLMLFRLIEDVLPDFFRPGREIHVARAPGRLDIMGGLFGADAAWNVQLPTAEAACVAVQARDDDLVRLWSPCRDGSRTQQLSMQLGSLGLPAAPIDYSEARALLTADPRDRWAGYVLGSLLALAREHALTPTTGAELLLHSDVPSGCGVAASAAVTTACLRAWALLYGLELSAAELARLAQVVEREVLAADGRVADAMTTVLGESGELLVLRGAAADLDERVHVPMDLEFIGLATGTDSRGDAQRATAGPGDAAGFERFKELLQQEPSSAHRGELGDLMFAAHERYAGHGLGDPAADVVVAAAKQRREAGGAVYGAKLSGRGGGGTVVLLGQRGKIWYEALRVKKALLEATGHSGHIFRWSSPGALSFGSITLAPNEGSDGG